MEALPYYKWHWQDWRANRRVQRMPWQAKGPYRELLDEFWSEGSLPNDMRELADIVGCTEAELSELWVYIGPCWEERDGRLYNAKMDLQRTSTDRARVAMSTGGVAGGKASNSFTRAKGSNVHPKPTLDLPQGRPDIEEKTREEKTREELGPSMVATMVLQDLALSGQEVHRNVASISKAKMLIGTDPQLLRVLMVTAHQRYVQMCSEGRLESRFKKKPANFFGDGDWENEPAWPWKEGKAPPPPNIRRHDPLEEIRRQNGGVQ